MNILMIGNGFDLEHDLPTKYTDFLKFVEDFHYAYLSASANPPRLNDIKNEYLKRIFENCELNDRVNAMYTFTEKNLWIAYFKKVHKEHLVNKENWIDFESEISSVVQAMDELIKYYESVNTGKNENESLEEYYKERVSKIIESPSLETNIIKSTVPILINDLNKLIGALEVYIWDYIGSQRVKYYNPDIDQINTEKVFSFNYSDTYRRLYAYNRKNIDYSFVHGMATNNIHFWNKQVYSEEDIEKCLQRNVDSNNMVLGIDEYLSKDRRSKDITFITFKKYYQRIYKRNGNEYKKWLQQIDENVAAGRKEENILHIFGHSLDITDADILREFINHRYIKTIVYYRDKKQLGQQIANLVKVLKSEKVIEKIYGSNPTIIFHEQSKRELIEGSAFEIASDTMQLKNIYKWSDLDARNLVIKIKNKVEKKDLNYFYSQKAVITLFDVLQKNGLAKLYAMKLQEIAYELMKCDGLQEPDQYNCDFWSYQDYDNSFGCDKLTGKFINAINVFNRMNFIAEKPVMQSFNEQLDKYQKLIDDKIEIDKDGYITIIDGIFSVFNDGYVNIENLWNMLLRISRGPGEKIAKDTLKELIKLSNDELSIIRYNHLLLEIQVNEYFEMIAENFEEANYDEQ